MKIRLFFVFTIFCFHSLMAQSLSENERNSLTEQGYHARATYQLPERPGLIDYEKAMLAGNSTIRAAYGKWQAEMKKIAAAKGLPDPKINFGYFIQNIETAVGPQEYKIGIMQTIPWLGKLWAQGDIQARKAEASYEHLQSEIDGQLLKLRHLYYELYYLERAIDITRQNLDLVKNWEEVILSKYKTGMARHANLVKTQIETIKLGDDLETLVSKRQPLTAAFAALLNRPGIDKIHVPDRLNYRAVTYNKEDLVSTILENNSGLRQLHLLEKAANKALTRARLNYLPDFSIGVDKIFTGDRWNGSGQPVPESGKDPLVVMGSVNIPIWFYKQKAGVEAAKHLEKQAEARTNERENTIRAEVEKVLFELADAERKMVLYKDILIPKSLESLRTSETAYIGDEADFLNVIDAQRRHLQFMLASERALVNHSNVRARLEALAGRTL